MANISLASKLDRVMRLINCRYHCYDGRSSESKRESREQRVSDDVLPPELLNFSPLLSTHPPPRPDLYSRIEGRRTLIKKKKRKEKDRKSEALNHADTKEKCSEKKGSRSVKKIAELFQWPQRRNSRHLRPSAEGSGYIGTASRSPILPTAGRQDLASLRPSPWFFLLTVSITSPTKVTDQGSQFRTV